MANDRLDYWPQVHGDAPGVRHALLQRLASDLAVMTADQESRRPSDQRCCEIRFIHRGEQWLGFLCSPTNVYGRCDHVHHNYVVFKA